MPQIDQSIRHQLHTVVTLLFELKAASQMLVVDNAEKQDSFETIALSKLVRLGLSLVAPERRRW